MTTNSMSRFNPFVGQPVRSIQTLLRKIAQAYPDIPPVIPDGKFGKQTTESVRQFQKKFGLVETGEVDNDTWDKILVVNDDVSQYMDEPERAKLYPGPQYVILPGESSVHLYVIQAMTLPLAHHFSNIHPVRITGVHDHDSVEAAIRLQKIFGMEQNGMIEKEYWNMLSAVYESFISDNRFEPHRNQK